MLSELSLRFGGGGSVSLHGFREEFRRRLVRLLVLVGIGLTGSLGRTSPTINQGITVERNVFSGTTCT